VLPADRRVVAVVGPTAVGKSALGLALAHALGGEVVNADSMQLYRGMDIGTAKLPPDRREGVAHHLIDIWDVVEPASVATYQQLARAVVDDLLHRAVVPILVGGSGLYVRAVTDDLRFPGTDPRVRARLEAELALLGAETLHRRLAARDPAAAAAITPSNGRRIVRALEVGEISGGPFVAQLPRYGADRTAPGPYPVTLLGLDLPIAELDARIVARVEQMWEQGFVAEVAGLVGRGLRAGRTASRALGYAQVLRMLDGTLSETAARSETARATRKFARRQRAWFRRDPRVRWLSGSADEVVATALSEARTARPVR
jgi:tRNA dimethylallyltransferase